MARKSVRYKGLKRIYALILTDEADAIAAKELGCGDYHAGQEILFKTFRARKDAHDSINRRAEQIRANRKKKAPQSVPSSGKEKDGQENKTRRSACNITGICQRD